MIISKTPFRLSLGGGGTDLREYYSRYGSFFISAAINRYVYITVNPRTIDRQIWVSYSKIEQATDVGGISHDIVRECLRAANISDSIEIHSITELSGGTGMGSSGSFCVGLLNALSGFQGRKPDAQELAELAFDVEANRVKAPVGKQDHYIAAYGGMRKFEINKQGVVKTSAVQFPDGAAKRLERSLMLFYTGVQRRAYAVLEEQTSSVGKGSSRAVESLHEIKEIGIQTAQAMEKGDIEAIGPLMHRHWDAKKRISGKMSATWIDSCYETAMSLGATGGKIVGAGGGGFLMFFVPSAKARAPLRRRLESDGLLFMPFRFEPKGSRVILND